MLLTHGTKFLKKGLKASQYRLKRLTKELQTHPGSYLNEKNQDVKFELYSAKQLNDVLKHFYLEARKPDGEMNKINSLESFRYSLNRYLKSPPYLKDFDILKHEAFNESNLVFKTALTELKANGKGATELSTTL